MGPYGMSPHCPYILWGLRDGTDSLDRGLQRGLHGIVMYILLFLVPCHGTHGSPKFPLDSRWQYWTTLSIASLVVVSLVPRRLLGMRLTLLTWIFICMCIAETLQNVKHWKLLHLFYHTLVSTTIIQADKVLCERHCVLNTANDLHTIMSSWSLGHVHSVALMCMLQKSVVCVWM